jgi:hypothetical protein
LAAQLPTLEIDEVACCADCHAEAYGGEPAEAGYISIMPLSEVEHATITHPDQLFNAISAVPMNGVPHIIRLDFPGGAVTTTGTQVAVISVSGNRYVILDSLGEANQTWNRNQTSGRHFTVSTGGTLELRNVTLSRYDASAWPAANTTTSGGVQATGTGHIRMTHENATISNNRGANGGGVQLGQRGGRLTMTAGNIIHNTATNTDINQGGGGVFADGLGTTSYITIAGGRISGNHSDGQGGGIGLCCNVNVMIGGSAQIDNNTADTSGGGIGMGGAASGINTLTIEGGTIHGNTAGTTGGGIQTGSNSNQGPISVTMTGGHIFNNRAGTHGGGVHVTATITNPTSFNMSGGTIGNAIPGYGNEAELGGGVHVSMSFAGTLFAMTGGRIIGNEAELGGGVHVAGGANSGNFHMTGGGILHNTANNGGGLYTSRVDNAPLTWIHIASGAAFAHNVARNGMAVNHDLAALAHNAANIVPGTRSLPPTAHAFTNHDINTYSGYVYEWHVENARGEQTVDFPFHKTGQNIYSAPNWGDPGWIAQQLRAGAEFSIFRYAGAGTPAAGLVTQAMIDADEWEYVDSGTSTDDPDQPLLFQLLPGRYYQLIETVPPVGYQLPWGQWRIVAVQRASDGATGFRITYQGDPTVPAFVNILANGGTNPIDTTYNAHFGGTFYVGNRLTLDLPVLGGLGRDMFLIGGLLTLLLAMGGGTFYLRRVRRGE